MSSALIPRLAAALDPMNRPYEVIFIDEDEEDQKKCAQCGELSSELDDAGYCDTCQPQDDADEMEEA